jgi:hypothetical protein
MARIGRKSYVIVTWTVHGGSKRSSLQLLVFTKPLDDSQSAADPDHSSSHANVGFVQVV